MPEQQNIEWKASWRDEYLKWICGFANAKGGKLIIGKDNNGNIVGVESSKRLMDDLPNKIQNHLGIICEIDLHEHENKHYIEIFVKPYNVPISYQGKYHYRSGSTKQELKGTVLNEFLLKKAGKTWDDINEASASYDDIDSKTVEKFKEDAVNSKRWIAVKGETNYHRIFENLQLTDKNELKRAALVLFGKNPRKYFINAYAKIGKFGKSDHDLQSQEVIETNAYSLANEIIEILDKKYFIKTISYKGLHRVETPPYPYEAIREALINAVIHRNYFGPPIQISLYDDKIMIWNVGQLPEELSIDDLKRKHSSFPRNPRLAEAFFKGGLIEAWGRGTLKIINECKEYGLPEPDIEIMSGGICVTIYQNKLTDEYLEKLGINHRQKLVIKYLKTTERITNKEYQEQTGCSDRTASRDLKELVEKRVLRSSGTKGVGAFYELITPITP
jgi:ATP-dependent DNA helicase RecG